MSFRRDCEDLLAAGYPRGYSLAAAAHQMTLGRRLRDAHEAERRAAKAAGQPLPVDTTYLSALERVEARLQAALRGLDRAAQSETERAATERLGRDPTQVVERELDQAEAWIQQHIGEYTDRCPGCGQMLTVPALPHWAFAPYQTAAGTLWPVWSPECWALVETGHLTLGQMALILRTSPEALRDTARRRGDAWPAAMDLAQEEQWLRRWLGRRERSTRGLAAPEPAREP